MIKQNSLIPAMIATAIAASGARFRTKPFAAGRRITNTPPAIQKQIWEAAEAKRQRRAARNLANAKMPQGDLL